MKRASVLVVDDDHEFATSLGEWVREHGIEASVAHDAPTALLAVQGELYPKIALVDINLPVVDGYELGQRLRARGVEHLIAVTGIADESRSLSNQFDAHFTKPVDFSELDRVLQKLTGAD
jgi:CheY-like chemotaxis protein